MNLSNMAIGDDNKKKLIALGGLVIVLILVMIYLFAFHRGNSSSTTTAENPPTAPPPDMPGGPGQPAAANASAPAGGGNVTAVSLASLSGPRPDPFTPQYIVPPPPPPPPVQLPQPEALPSPQGIYAGLPPAYIGGHQVAGNTPSTALVGLPPIVLPRMAHPPTAPQKFEAPKQAGGAGLASPSFNKRLSGVIIGNSVHALLEVSNASGIQTYVVQPGDTVAGIRILGIQRVEVGGKTVPRMLISENGEEKYVDLRASFNPQTDQVPGGVGPDGMPAAPGAFPGKPTIFPAPSMRPGQQIGRGANPFSAN
jgi:hypothetical protein